MFHGDADVRQKDRGTIVNNRYRTYDGIPYLACSSVGMIKKFRELHAHSLAPGADRAFGQDRVAE